MTCSYGIVSATQHKHTAVVFRNEILFARRLDRIAEIANCGVDTLRRLYVCVTTLKESLKSTANTHNTGRNGPINFKGGGARKEGVY